MLRLIFMGTPEFAVSALDAAAAGHEVVAVYTQPPRPAKRGQRSQPSPVQIRAEELGIPVYSPASLSDAEAQRQLQALDADVALVAAYGLILPRAVLDAPRLGCINIHPSLLPRWRGAAPIQRAIMAADAETGVSIMRLEEGLDSGPVYLSKATTISAGDDYGALHARLAKIGAAAALTVLDGLEDGTATAHPQSEIGTTYAEKIDKAEAHIDWDQSVEAIDRLVRALGPRPGAWCEIGGERLKVLGGELCDHSGPAGEVLDDKLTVAGKSGAYRITKAQRPGRAAIDAETLLRGFPVAAGTKVL